MGNVTYVEFNGAAHTVEVKPGQSLMEGAMSSMVPGILADCGGACACATCHVYVDAAWTDRVGPASQMESDMLDVLDCRQPNSRLSCQIRMSAAFDNLVLQLPETQG